MKKLILTAIVVLACVVNAAPGSSWSFQPSQPSEPINTPWDGKGNPEWNKGNPTNLYQEYTATNGSVQFEYSWGPEAKNQLWSYERIGANTGWKYENGTFEFTSKYVWTDFDYRLDTRAGIPGTVVEYGYYTIGDDGHVSDPITLWVKGTDEQAAIHNSVIFKQGEKIGIYMTIDEGKGQNVTFTSTKADIAKPNTSAAVPNVDTDSRGDEKQFFCLFDNRKPNTGIGNFSHFEYHFGGLVASDGSYDEFIEQVIKEDGGKTNITDSDGNPVSGQPLPGTLATLLIGGLCAGSLRKRNKK